MGTGEAPTDDFLDDEVEVWVKHGNGAEGVGWYVMEYDYEDEGYAGFFDHDPTAEELKAICPEYRRV